VNVRDVVDDPRTLIAACRPVHPVRLADRNVALTDVVTPLAHRA
jgi:hypothetical protein